MDLGLTSNPNLVSLDDDRGSVVAERCRLGIREHCNRQSTNWASIQRLSLSLAPASTERHVPHTTTLAHWALGRCVWVPSEETGPRNTASWGTLRPATRHRPWHPRTPGRDTGRPTLQEEETHKPPGSHPSLRRPSWDSIQRLSPSLATTALNSTSCGVHRDTAKSGFHWPWDLTLTLGWCVRFPSEEAWLPNRAAEGL